MLGAEMKGSIQPRWWTLVGFLVVCVSLVQTRKGERPRYRTAYACEGSQLHISCEGGSLIHLIRANYGRFSISICNEHGNLDWSVDCTSHRSYYVIADSCGMKNSCAVPASSAVFGDPCPGTFKYLEAHYQCVPESTTTTTSTTSTTTTSTTTRPPIIIPLTQYFRPGISSTSSPSSSPIPSTSTTTTPTSTTVSVTMSSAISSSSVPSSVTSSRPKSVTSTTTTLAPIPDRPSSSTSRSHPIDPQVFLHRTTEAPYRPITKEEGHQSLLPSVDGEQPTELAFCPPVHSRELYWNWTRGGETVIQKCPGGALGRAKWMCASDPVRWVQNTPDLSECNSVWIDNLKHRMDIGDSVVSIAAELAHRTRAKPLYGGDVIHTARLIQDLVSKMADSVRDIAEERQKHQVVKELMQSILEVSNNLLEDVQSDSWRDLPPSEQRRVVSALLKGLEESGVLLAETQHREYQFSRAQSSVLVSVRLVEAWAVSADVRFPTEDDIKGTLWMRMEESLVLPAQSVLSGAKNGVVKVVMLAYKSVADFLTPGIMHRQLASSSYSHRAGGNVTRIINSRVIAASLGRDYTLKLPQPVTIVLRHVQEENVSNPQCVFWDFNISDWSGRGCWVHSFNTTHTVCACDHLTNFAVMMDLQASKPNKEHHLMLRIVAYVGCAIAMLGLFLTAIILQFIRNLKGDRVSIHKNLCLCLLIAEAVFVGGIDRVRMRVVCGVIAGLLHYFLLAGFSWIFIEGFHMFAMLIDVFDSEKSRVRWYYGVAYGLPALIVAISAVIDANSFGTTDYCWLKMDNFHIFSFVGPAIGCVLACLLFLSLALLKAYRHEDFSASLKNKEQMKLTSVKVWSRGAVLVVVFVSATWTFGLLYLYHETEVLAYIFAVLNSSQGFCIFIFCCAKNDKVRNGFQKSVRRAEWLPECIRKPKTQERRPSMYVHGNGTLPLPTVTGQHSLPHLSWNLANDQKESCTNTTILSFVTPVGPQSIATLNPLKPDEISRRKWYRGSLQKMSQSSQCIAAAEESSGSNTVPTFGRFPTGNNTMPSYFSGTLVDYDDDLLQPCPPDHQYHQRAHKTDPYSQVVDHIYECIDDASVTAVNQAERRCVTTRGRSRHYDHRPNDPRDPSAAPQTVATTIQQPQTRWSPVPSLVSGTERKLLRTITAALNSSPRPHHFSLLRDGCLRPQMNYSGFASPTDSERSSSSMMDDSHQDASSSTSPDFASSQSGDLADSQLLQSLPNIRLWEGTSDPPSPHVLKYPSENEMTAVGAEAEEQLHRHQAPVASSRAGEQSIPARYRAQHGTVSKSEC